MKAGEKDGLEIKPLYTANDGWTFRFASQVKALLAGGGVSREAEPAGVVGFHLFGSVPEPFTLYREIRALPAGHSQWIDGMGPREPHAFFDMAAVLAEGVNHASPTESLDAKVKAAVSDSVRAHLLADVEVGGEEGLERDRACGLAGADQLRGDLVDLLVQHFREVLGLEKVRDAIEGVVVDEDRAQQGLLGLEVLRCRAELRRGGFGQLADVRFGGCHGLDSEKSVSKVGVQGRRRHSNVNTTSGTLRMAVARALSRASV